MLLVTPTSVGVAGYSRMVRDGVIVPVMQGVALPRDIDLTEALRRHVLASIAPPGSQVTALAALWAHGFAPLPHQIDVRMPRRAALRRDPHSIPVVAHAARDAEASLGRPVADASRAALDALVWSPLDIAVPAVLCALDAGRVTTSELRTGSGGRDALALIDAALLERGGAVTAPLGTRQGRLEPVMRRAS